MALKQKIISFAALALSMVCLASSVQAQTWQETLEQNVPNVIDVVTFDDYDDQIPQDWGGKKHFDSNLDGSGYDGPTKNSGQDTNWDTFNMWKETQPQNYKGVNRDWGSNVIKANA